MYQFRWLPPLSSNRSSVDWEPVSFNRPRNIVQAFLPYTCNTLSARLFPLAFESLLAVVYIGVGIQRIGETIAYHFDVVAGVECAVESVVCTRRQ
jgi:hypothetical protein